MIGEMSSRFLDLEEIAAWQIAAPQRLHPDITATLPPLQRGAVWKPAQAELLWDSIFRGLPIGSFVVCRYLRSQGDRDLKFGSSGTATHHLLDGQQRANAIALAFHDP